ncbi:hypothetical protein BDN72DRAFT_146893 [Pluteus cervinus]|uniref:Uncharacterized protein n=1 Tax=Pluteus cervinus TaxID=181527 RepID=A0ACD3AL66_9AGAR|nr:hypothetical protein BDN72DRAFT_146893 [Pluteus cervinus]
MVYVLAFGLTRRAKDTHYSYCHPERRNIPTYKRFFLSPPKVGSVVEPNPHSLTSMKLSVLAALLASATTINAHATFQQFWVNGKDQAGTCVRKPSTNNPVGATQADMACNVGGNNPAPSTCAVNAGDTVSVEMHQQPGDRTCTTEAIGGNHDGPTVIYLAKVDNAATAQGASAGWFKIGQTGLVRTDYWGTDVMNANCGKVDVKIPLDIAPGDYLLRAEVIALHVAGSVGGAQLYMSCFQLKINSAGKASPPTVRFPGAYSPNDPGILFNLYGSYSTYTVPGPAVYTGGSAPAPPSVPPSSTTPTATVPPPPPVTTPTSATVPAGPQATHFQQCGGSGYNGPTVCASPYKCTYSNDWYSQCL